MLSLLLLVVNLLVGLAASQIDPSSVPLSTRENWCQIQTSSCPLICLQVKDSGSPKSNSCNAKNLTYDCICSNGISPNSSEYSETLPYFICTERNNQCVDNCNGQASCQAACRDAHPCGAQSPQRINATTSPTSATPTASSSATDVVYDGSQPVTATTNAAPGLSPVALTVGMGHAYGVFVVVGWFLVGFATL